ncbi:hypothetical protein AURDEDRAFT_123437 [Auricularia subglabra TFB-10046 SS5]|nr:hypothetical protein AURDEDRAFT_123437 [Auricularia subglabra TFB-10046 SS5]
MRGQHDRIHALAPIRSFMIAPHSPSDAVCAPVYNHYFGLADLAGRSLMHSFDPDIVASIEPELPNVEALFRHWLSGTRDCARTVVEAAMGLGHIHSLTSLGSGPELLVLALPVARAAGLEELEATMLYESARAAHNILSAGDPESLFRDAREIYTRIGNVPGVIDCTLALTFDVSPAEAIRETQRAEDLAASINDPRRVAKCAQYASLAYERDGDVEAALKENLRALSILEPRGPDFLTGMVKRHLAVNYLMAGNAIYAQRTYEEALRMFELVQHPRGMLTTHIQLASFLLFQGRPREAAQHAECALAVRQAQGFRWYVTGILRLAESYAAMGDADAATAAFDRLRRTNLSGLPNSAQEDIWATSASLAMLRGDLVHARAMLSARQSFIHSHVRNEAFDATLGSEGTRLALLGEVECADGHAERAFVPAITAAVICHRGGEVIGVLRCLAILAYAVDDALAEALLDAILLPLQRLGHVIGLSICLLRSAMVARSRGERNLAHHRESRARELLSGCEGELNFRLMAVQTVSDLP